MKLDVEPNIEQDPSWHQEPGALPTGNGDTFSVHEVHFGGRPVVREVLETVILTLLVFLGVRMIVQNFMVEGTSMEPTLHNAQYLLVNKAAYAQWDPQFLARLNPFQEGEPPAAGLTYVLGGPQRGDIVVFHAPNDTRDFIKRVIGLPGEKVQVKANDGVYVDDHKLDEPYIKDIPNYDWPGPNQATAVPPDEIFVLGDNRWSSDDSHVFGPIPMTSVIGRAWFCYWPSAQIGPLPHPTYPTPTAP